MGFIRRWFGLILVCTGLAAGGGPAQALNNGLALTPPMGYNDWNAFGCDVSAQLIMETADAMVANGMRDAGYKYVTMDDCWMAGSDEPRGSAARLSAGRDASTGELVPDPADFPNGIKVVADYVHARGLKLGIYEDVGTATCQGLAGSYQHEVQDAKTFAKWGVDYLKYDFCNVPTTGEFTGMLQVDIAKVLYGRMRDALAASGRPIVFSMSLALESGLDQQTWAAPYGNLWRTTGDISDSWSSVVSIFKKNVEYAQYAGPGHWNDADMLEVGNGGMTTNEYRSHFSLWAIMASPLIAGTDVRDLSAADLEIMINREVIAVNQDRLGKQGTTLSHDGDLWIVQKQLADGSKAVVFFNEGKLPATMTLQLSKLSLNGRRGEDYIVRDLWKHETTEADSRLTVYVPGHGVQMYNISPESKSPWDRNWGHPQPVLPHVALAPSAAEAVANIGPVIEAGRSAVVTGSLFNDGREAIASVRIGLGTPSGWASKLTSAPKTVVKGTSSTSGSWRLTVPSSAAAGFYDLSFTGKDWVKGRWQQTAESLTITVPPAPPTTTSYLSDLSAMSVVGTLNKDKQVISSFGGSPTEYPITLNSTVYAKGLGTAQGSEIAYYVGGHCSSLTAAAGVDDHAQSFGGTPTATMRIRVDGVSVFQGTVTGGTAPTMITQSIAGAKVIELVVDGLSGFGVAAATDWADAKLVCN